MSSRHLHPLSARLPRAERAAVVAFACSRGVSISSVLKTALRAYLKGVDAGVDAHSQDRVATAPDGSPQHGQTPIAKPTSWGGRFEPVDARSVDQNDWFVDPDYPPFRRTWPKRLRRKGRGETGRRRAAFSMTRVAASRPRAVVKQVRTEKFLCKPLARSLSAGADSLAYYPRPRSVRGQAR
jgi:hypothetical protein